MEKLIEKCCAVFESFLEKISKRKNNETVECINFTKPNEKSYLTVGSGTLLDGSVFISVNYVPDGVEELVGTQREIRDERKEPIIAFRFYQAGSIDSFIEQLNWAKEHLDYKQEDEE